MEQPEGFKVSGSENKVLCLKKALYSLKQAGLAWWNILNDSMKELGFEQIKSDPDIFLYKRKGSLIVVAIVYVDNAVFCGPSKAIVDEIKGHFIRKWECQDLDEATEFLHICIKRHGHKIDIDQCAYLNKVIEHFGLQNANSTPCYDSLAMLSFFLGLLFLFTDDTSVFTNCLMLSYNYSLSVITITPPSNVIT